MLHLSGLKLLLYIMDENIKEYHFQGGDLALESAKALFKVADKSYELEEYGIARSLYILSGEEAVKAMVIVTQTIKSDNQRTEGWDKVFRDHKTKHDDLKMVTFLVNFTIKNFDEHLNKIRLAGASEAMIEQTFKMHPMLIEEYEWIKRRKQNPITLEEASKWWEQANIEKNKGFYLAEMNNQWLNPRSINSEQAALGKKYVQVIIEFIEKFINDMHRPEFWNIIKENPLPE